MKKIFRYIMVLLIGLGTHSAYAFQGSGNARSQTAVVPASGSGNHVTTLSKEQAALSAAAAAEGISVDLRPGISTSFSIRGKALGQRRSFSRGKGLARQGKGDYGKDAVAVLDNLSGFLSVRDAQQEFSARKVETDQLGYNHVRMTQKHAGLRVVGGDLITHFDANDAAYQINGTYIPNIDVITVPGIDAAKALQVAHQDAEFLGKTVTRTAAEPELVVFARESAPLLAYEMALSTKGSPTTAPGLWRYWIDAQSGKVLSRYNDIKDIAKPTNNGLDFTISGNMLPGEGGALTNVTGWYENSGYYYLYNKLNQWFIFNAATNGYSDINTYAFRASSSWSISDPAEISGAVGFDATQTYYANVHNRNSYDNADTYAWANLHVGSSFVNAYWDSDVQQFFFGDGNGVNANSLVVLDVIGHEFTHAVTEHTANLVYAYESGALNESFSDVFGACIEFANQPDGSGAYPASTAGKADWLMGEDCWLSSTALRDMRDPGNTATVGAGGVQPTRYDGSNWHTAPSDNGGVHINSGVQNLFFYLLCEGGSGNNDGINYNLTGIGIINAEQIAYRALTVYCTSTTDYRDCREAWISAAMDLNINWGAKVAAAWAAVGVGPLAISPQSTSVFKGDAGGPFSPSRFVYKLENLGDEPISWIKSNSASWCTVSPSSGTLAPGQSTWLSMELTAAADSKTSGVYTDVIQIKNAAESYLSCHNIMLRVGQAEPYTEVFDAFDFDLDGLSMTFTPDGSTDFYEANAVPIASLPVSNDGHNPITLGDDAFSLITLAGGSSVKLYGTSYSQLYIGSNGYITFGSGDLSFIDPYDLLTPHFAKPRISAWCFDLDPSAGGTVYWKQLSDRLVVTFTNVPDWLIGELHTFQYELYFDGKITLSWLGINLPYGLVGLSRGTGVPTNYIETDFSQFALDFDADGIPNAWELQYFSGNTNCVASVDSDSDGFSNLEEYITGTHPLDKNSFFQMTVVAPASDGSTNFVVDWNAVEGRDYNVLRKPNLTPGNFLPIAEGIWYPNNTYTDSVSEAQSANFYQVEVQMQ